MDHATGYLSDVLIILAAAVIVVPLFQRLRSSPVLGYLVAGILIGPSGLGIIGDVEGTMGLAHFGVVFLLFTIGLELSLERLRVIRRHVFGLGTLQVVITASVLWAGSRFMGIPNNGAILIGGALALSSTAIVLQMLMERGELSAQHGRVAFAILLLQDLAVVPLLTLVPLLAGDESGALWSIGLALFKALAALIIIIMVGRLLMRPLFRIIASARTPELFTGVVLLVVLGVSKVTELAGLSMALGAFLAGLVIAETEYRHQVEADIEPFRGVLLALFFMTVGMGIDLGLLADRTMTVIALVAVLMVTKTLVLTALCRLFGFSLGISAQVAIILAQGGEFALLLLALPMTMDVIPRETAEMLVVVVAITMAMTPLLPSLARIVGKWLTPPPTTALDEVAKKTGDLNEHVLIAGFGRVGQTLGRMLEAHHVPYVALDLDPQRVAEGRRRGLPVFYGDASRLEVLKAAGVHRAAAAVITLDQKEAAERAVNVLRRELPALPIFVRARDREHSAILERSGATAGIPELVEGSLHLGSAVLHAIGKPPEQVAMVLQEFRLETYARLSDFIPGRDETDTTRHPHKPSDVKAPS